MEIMQGVHQLPLEYHGRPLQLYLLSFGNDKLLMDCGDVETPTEHIWPYLEKLGVKPADLTHVLITHPDVDHCGGIHVVKAAAPQAKFYCGTADRDQIETPEGFTRFRSQLLTHWHRIGLTDDKVPEFVSKIGGAGSRVTMERTFSGGETLRIGDRELTILHLPGHSMGHLGVYLPWENAAIVGDAVHHTGNRYMDGRVSFAVTYMWVDAYFGTIAQLEAKKLDKLFSCHWANCQDKGAVLKFLQESREYAMKAETVILETLKAAGEGGVTLNEMCLKAKPGLGNWEPKYDSYTGMMACGHLQRLCDRGYARMEGSSIPVKYIFEKEWYGVR